MLKLTISDKRDSEALRDQNVDKYPAHSSFLSKLAKYGVVTSQMHRLWNICTARSEFDW